MPSTVASRPPWRGLALLAQDTEVKAKKQEEALVLKFSRSAPSPAPLSLQESLENTNVELCLHVCLFSFALPAQKQGPTGGKEGVCVCCVRLGLRGSGKGDESTHRGSHPQPERRVQVQALGEESRNLMPPPNLSP